MEKMNEKLSGKQELAGALTDEELRLAETTNAHFFKLYSNTSRYLVLRGGGGSGKSIFAGRKVLERISEPRAHKFLVVRKVARTLRESCYAQLQMQISTHFKPGDFKINKSDMTITHKNGNMILFSGLDDVEKLKSIYGITDVWIEEATELLEEDFNQLDIRCREKPSDYNQIILTFNPTSILHWLKKRFFDHTLDNCTVHNSTYADNRFLTPQAIEVLEGFKETDPYYYSVYCLNEWGITGKTIFNAQMITQRLREVPAYRTVRFAYSLSIDVHTKMPVISDIELVEDRRGFIRLYEEVREKEFYVIGGDTAGEGSDAFVGQCIDNTSLKQIAVLNHNFDAHEFADQIYCMGMYYNKALLSIETNAGGSYIVERLQRLGYENLYVREKQDTYLKKYEQAYGFNTNSATRKPLIDNLVETMNTSAGIEAINDRKTLEEMLSFVRSEQGRPQAQTGAHDDHVMALGIAHFTRHQQKVRIDSPVQKPKYSFDEPVRGKGSLDTGETIEVI